VCSVMRVSNLSQVAASILAELHNWCDTKLVDRLSLSGMQRVCVGGSRVTEFVMASSFFYLNETRVKHVLKKHQSGMCMFICVYIHFFIYILLLIHNMHILILTLLTPRMFLMPFQMTVFRTCDVRYFLPLKTLPYVHMWRTETSLSNVLFSFWCSASYIVQKISSVGIKRAPRLATLIHMHVYI
jgi:hypothetical protein